MTRSMIGKQIKVVDVDACKLMCDADATCLSMSFKTSGTRCRLSSKSAVGNNLALNQEKGGYEAFEKVVRTPATTGAGEAAGEGNGEGEGEGEGEGDGCGDGDGDGVTPFSRAMTKSIELTVTPMRDERSSVVISSKPTLTYCASERLENSIVTRMLKAAALTPMISTVTSSVVTLDADAKVA